MVWELPLVHAGLGGIAATQRYVIFGDRDADDFHDLFRCLDAETGKMIWEVRRLAVAALDYGNSPRATPMVSGDHVFCKGALGNLLCIRIDDGNVVWERNLRDDFPLSDELPWGYCGSPLLVDEKLIVAPGAPDASLVALDAMSGDVLWKSPGRPPSHGSLIVATLDGVRQIVGHDKTTLGGWDLESGERLWTITPPSDGDFNVPTPIVESDADGRDVLLVATENNGVRSFRFEATAHAAERLVAGSPKLRTDMSTPVVVGSNLYCVKDFLYCLDAKDLSEQWRMRDRAIGEYAAIFATADRLLVVGKGELLLLNTGGEKKILSRQRVFDENQTLYSHPAIVGRRMYIRGEHKLRCLTFSDAD
ncbi:MAG: PQQ-binding-like beta-propeller repeat protein [Rubripirellula sp.]